MSFCPDIQTSGVQRGVNLLTIDPLSCTVLSSRNYDTFAYGVDVTALVTALTTAARGTLFVAVTGDEPRNLIMPAKSALMTKCNVDITSLQFRGNFAFVCVIGYPSKTKWQLLPAQNPGSSIAAAVSGELIGF